LNKNIKTKTLKMESFVACDLCTKNVEMSEVEAHYAQCSKPRNAFEVLMCTCGDKYLASRERQHILTDKHKNASAREVKNNENIILLNSQTVFPVKSYRINSTVQNTIDFKDFYEHCQKNIIEIIDRI